MVAIGRRELAERGRCDRVLDPELDSIARTRLPEATPAPLCIRARVVPDHDPVGSDHVSDPQRLLDRIAATPEEQVATELPERVAEIGERLRQEGPSARARSAVEERVVEDEERRDHPAVVRRPAERGLVVDAQVAREEDDGGGRSDGARQLRQSLRLVHRSAREDLDVVAQVRAVGARATETETVPGCEVCELGAVAPERARGDRTHDHEPGIARVRAASATLASGVSAPR